MNRPITARETRNPRQHPPSLLFRPSYPYPDLAGKLRLRFALLIGCCVLLELSCGVPAEPQPRHPLIPQAVTDLSAHQRGDGALLTFTAPARDTDGDPLTSPPSIEILRGFAPLAAPSPASGSLHLAYTILGPALETYRKGDRVEFQDPIPSDEIARHAGDRIFYIVRARASRRAASEDSDVATFPVRPAPSPIADLRATVIEAGVQLNWQPPATVSGGAPLTNLAGYRIYRVETAVGGKPLEEPLPPAVAGDSSSPAFLDAPIEWGNSYVYTVRSLAQYGADTLESGDSNPVEVTPKDVFPPAPPIGLVGVFVPAAAASPAAVELSWAISPEPDASGYYVYRTGEGQENPKRVTPNQLLTPAFRDISITPGASYWYVVTAVDRSGNESQPSKPILMQIPGAGN